MPERLASLTRQKQLIEEHLRWLDAEIANESPATILKSNTPAAIEPTPAAAFETVSTSNAAATPSQMAEEDLEALTERLISQYAHVSTRREIDPRLGLVLFFGGLLGIMDSPFSSFTGSATDNFS